MKRGRLLYLLFFVLLLSFKFVYAINANLIGSIPATGFTHQVAYFGNYAYVASDKFGLVVINVSNPNNMVVVGSSNLPFNGQYLAVSGNIAVVSGTRTYHSPPGVSSTNISLFVIDISNPSAPKVLGSIMNNSLAFAGLSISGNYAYVASGSLGMLSVNITDPTNPKVVGRYDTPGWANSVTVVGNYAYVADGSMGLRILDISNPTNPVNVGTVDTPGSSYSVAISGNYAYVADSTSVQIINIANPAAPSIVGSASVGAADVKVQNNVVYVAASSTGLVSINVANPVAPVILNTLAPSGAANPSTQGLFISGNYAYVANGAGGLSIVNITNPSSMSLVGYNSAYYEMHYLASKPGIVVLSGIYHPSSSQANNSLIVVDISNPSAPKVLGSIMNNSLAFAGLSISGNYAYVASGSLGMLSVNITDPTNPKVVGRYDTPGWANSVTVVGNYAYVADGSMGLRILDISNPTNPVNVGTVDTPGSSYSVAISGNYAYVADSTSVQIINIANPAAPSIVGSASVGAADVKVQNNVVYVAASSTGLVSINVANPVAPVILNTLAPSGAANPSTQGLFISGNYAYVANGAGGLSIVNITNPSSMVLLNSTLTFGNTLNVVSDGNYAYVADDISGISIVDDTSTISNQNYIPADTNQDWLISSGESTIYRNLFLTTPAVTPDFATVARNIYLTTPNGAYHYVSGTTCPPSSAGLCWIPG